MSTDAVLLCTMNIMPERTDLCSHVCGAGQAGFALQRGRYGDECRGVMEEGAAGMRGLILITYDR